VLDVYCPHCKAVGLFWPSQVRLINSALGIEAAVDCYCGRPLEVLLGRGPNVAAGGWRQPRTAGCVV
jgi:alkyl hydroperoxide reductase subunit AhpF